MGGFFQQHATFSTGGGEFEVAEAGVYTCRLIEVVPEERPSFDNPDVMQPQFKWVFEADQDDSKGNPFRFIKWTGVKYGNDKAGITMLLDGMLERRLTQQEFAELDLDELRSQTWKVMVDEYTTQKGQQANKIVSVKPRQRRQQGGSSVAPAPQNIRQASNNSNPGRPTGYTAPPTRPQPERVHAGGPKPEDEDFGDDPFANEADDDVTGIGVFVAE